MTQTESEKQKRECWEEFQLANRTTLETTKQAFEYIFDRAYALGKQTETITQEEIEKAAREAVRKEYLCKSCAWKENCDHCEGENTAFDCCECPADSYEDGFKAGANFALGKQEKDAEDDSLWSRLTDDEKREMQCRYHTNECVLRDHRKRTGDKAQSKAVARMKLLENLFGKDNLKVEKK